MAAQTATIRTSPPSDRRRRHATDWRRLRERLAGADVRSAAARAGAPDRPDLARATAATRGRQPNEYPAPTDSQTNVFAMMDLLCVRPYAEL